MATLHGIPGEWARVKGTVAGLWPLFIGIFVLGFSLAFFWVVPLVGAILAVLALLYIGLSVRRGLRHVERFFKGARGEERVSAILRELPDGYHVFNDYEACGRHVDHVVACPAGVFAIETKFWSGKVTIEDGHILLDGQLPNRSPLAQAREEAQAVRNELAKRGENRPVTPVLAFASNTFEAKIAECGGVVVLNANHLRESFAPGRVVIAPAEFARLVRLMA